ncbi:MAG: YciI family protein, partial [Planctomycetota bacterium]
MAKFLFIFRHSTDPANQPSPEEMQELGQQWYGWMTKFKASILAGGDGLKPGGKLMRGEIVTDGPYIEAKEFVASFSLIQAD